MNVYFGKMDNDIECSNFQCKSNGIEYFGGIQTGDYVFIRLKSDGAVVSRLWKLRNIANEGDETVAYFDDVFSFNSLKTDRFSKLRLFKIDTNLVIFTKRQQTGVGFNKLELVNEEEFINVVSSRTSFNDFLDNDNNYRKIVFIRDASEPRSSKDVQIIKDNNMYKIHNSDQDFLRGLNDNFNTNRYSEFCDYLLANPTLANDNRLQNSQKKVKKWLESEGNSKNISLIDLWDLFCSKKNLSNKSKTDEEIEESTEINSEELHPLLEVNIIEILKNYVDNDYKQIILTGAPGTGKTHSVKEFTGCGENVMFVQFHPSYDYSDFVEGLRPVMLTKGGNPTFVRIDGTFKKFCRKVVEENIKKKYKKNFDRNYQYETFLEEYKALELDKELQLDKYYFIIDEINRADLSKVFGELMYSLESSYRGLINKAGKFNLISTQYTNLSTYEVENGLAKEIEFDCFDKGFFIPKNIYIIGTMNDIDRSVEAFDFALRRRFEWVEIKANDVFYEGARNMLKLSDNKIKDLSEKVIKMNNIISKENNQFMLTEAYHIGHAYFKTYDGTIESLERIFNTNIISILKEYTRGRNRKIVEEYLIKPCAKELGVEIDE